MRLFNIRIVAGILLSVLTVFSIACVTEEPSTIMTADFVVSKLLDIDDDNPRLARGIVGDTVRIVENKYDEKCCLKFASSDETVATVDKYGAVVFRNYGTSNVGVAYKDELLDIYNIAVMGNSNIIIDKDTATVMLEDVKMMYIKDFSEETGLAVAQIYAPFSKTTLRRTGVSFIVSAPSMQELADRRNLSLLDTAMVSDTTYLGSVIFSAADSSNVMFVNGGNFEIVPSGDRAFSVKYNGNYHDTIAVNVEYESPIN